MLIFGCVATKGGVGKTTLSANLGALFARTGFRVLLVDADIQASLTKFFPLNYTAPFGLVSVVQTGIVSEICISHTDFENLDIIISDAPRRQLSVDNSNSDIERFLSSRMDMPLILRRALRSEFVEENYDIVIIDTPGAQGHLLSTAALAAHKLICPILPETLSAREFNAGTIALLNKLGEAKALGVTHGDVIAVINRATKTKDAQNIIDIIRKSYIEHSGQVTVAHTVIQESVIFNEAASLRQPIFAVMKRGSKVHSQALLALARELVPTISNVYVDGIDNDDALDDEASTPSSEAEAGTGAST